MGSDDSHFFIRLWCAKSQGIVYKLQFLKRKGSQSGKLNHHHQLTKIKPTSSAYQLNALPLGQTDSGCSKWIHYSVCISCGMWPDHCVYISCGKQPNYCFILHVGSDPITVFYISCGKQPSYCVYIPCGKWPNYCVYISCGKWPSQCVCISIWCGKWPYYCTRVLKVKGQRRAAQSEGFDADHLHTSE